MVKGIDFKLGFDSVQKLSKEELLKLAKPAEQAVAIDVKPVSDISAENYRQFALKLDPPMVRRFGSEHYMIPDFSQLSRERQIEIISDAIRQNAPKTKEEAFARLEHGIQELKKMNVDVPEGIIQTLKNDIIKKFGG